MSAMTQTEWAARVAAIGAMAGWSGRQVRQLDLPRTAFAAMACALSEEADPAVIAAIRQLLADWLAGVGVVAHRVCRWTYHDHTCHWDGACGVAWSTIEGGLVENRMHYCPRCGGKIEVTA